MRTILATIALAAIATSANAQMRTDSSQTEINVCVAIQETPHPTVVTAPARVTIPSDWRPGQRGSFHAGRLSGHFRDRAIEGGYAPHYFDSNCFGAPTVAEVNVLVDHWIELVRKKDTPRQTIPFAPIWPEMIGWAHRYDLSNPPRSSYAAVPVT